jgi:hypothetical protein
MLDKLEETVDLMAALKAAVPFEADLTPELVAHLRAERLASDIAARQIVREVSYAGDERGALRHIEPEGLGRRLLVSLTHLRLKRSLPFAPAALDYQQRRVKKLKKQRPTS